MICCGWILFKNINEIDCSTFSCWFSVPSPSHFPVTFISSASLSYFFPLPRSPCHPSLPGVWFPSHLESVPAVGQSLALPGAWEKSPPGVPTCIPALCVAYPLFQVCDSLASGVRSRCRSVTCASRCERKVAPRSPIPHPSPLCGRSVLQGARFPSHLELEMAVVQWFAVPGVN